MRLPAGPCWAWTMLRTVWGVSFSYLSAHIATLLIPYFLESRQGTKMGLSLGGGFTSLFCYSEEDVLDFT